MAGANVAITAARAAGAEKRASVEYMLATQLYDRSIQDVETSAYKRTKRNTMEARCMVLRAEELALQSPDEKKTDPQPVTSQAMQVAVVKVVRPEACRDPEGQTARPDIHRARSARASEKFPDTLKFIMTHSSGRCCTRPIGVELWIPI